MLDPRTSGRFSINLDNFQEYISEPIWRQTPNLSTYYDRKLDLQGVVPGISFEEAKSIFEQEYGIPL